MSDEVLADLDFPEVDVFLGVGSGTHGVQTAKVLSAFEKVLLDDRARRRASSPATSTPRSPARSPRPSSASPIAHLEAGLRSFDWSMPEEVNRVLTDRLSDVLLHAQPGGGRQPAGRGHRPGPRLLRRQHDDRLAAPLREARARRCAAWDDGRHGASASTCS